MAADTIPTESIISQIRTDKIKRRRYTRYQMTMDIESEHVLMIAKLFNELPGDRSEKHFLSPLASNIKSQEKQDILNNGAAVDQAMIIADSNVDSPKLTRTFDLSSYIFPGDRKSVV